MSPNATWEEPAASVPARVPVRRRQPPAVRPVAWRELNSTLLLQGTPLISILLLAVFAEWVWLTRPFMSGAERDVVTTLFTIGGLVVSALCMIGLSCRTFASERERQTLDVLLATPLSNTDLLNEKLSASNRLTLILTAAILGFGVVRTVYGDHSRPWSWEAGIPASGSPSMAGYSIRLMVRYLSGLAAHCLVYLTLVKWISVGFSLRMNSLMKSLTGTLISVILLCTAPAAITAFVMILNQANPDHFPVWWFLSPVTILMFNELHELREVHDLGFSLSADYGVLLINLLVYGVLTLAIRWTVRCQVGALLNRRDGSVPTGV